MRPGCGRELVEGTRRCVSGAGRWGPRGRASGRGRARSWKGSWAGGSLLAAFRSLAPRA